MEGPCFFGFPQKRHPTRSVLVLDPNHPRWFESPSRSCPTLRDSLLIAPSNHKRLLSEAMKDAARVAKATGIALESPEHLKTSVHHLLHEVSAQRRDEKCNTPPKRNGLGGGGLSPGIPCVVPIPFFGKTTTIETSAHRPIKTNNSGNQWGSGHVSICICVE